MRHVLPFHNCHNYIYANALQGDVFLQDNHEMVTICMVHDTYIAMVQVQYSEIRYSSCGFKGNTDKNMQHAQSMNNGLSDAHKHVQLG